MPHVSEERNIAAPPERIWPIVADSRRWPEFFHTVDGRWRLARVERVSGELDAALSRRALHFVPALAWVEELARIDPVERIEWRGVDTPGLASVQSILELVPGRGFTTLRWDVFYKPSRFFGRKALKRDLEDAVLTALLEIDRLTMRDLALAAAARA